MPHRKYKVDWRSLCMNTLKFVCREDELSYAKDAINSNNFVVYYYFDNSGLSYYLKKLQTDLCKEGDVCSDCRQSPGQKSGLFFYHVFHISNFFP